MRENETRTRVALVDPILQALGWDVSDPDSVTLEFDVQGRRADYALLRANSRPAATIEAKKLGEALATHRMQMLNYANASSVDYAGLTDGNHWELYDVFKRGELGERELLNVAIGDAPAHESALKLLRLWRPNLVSQQPVEAAEPIAEIQAVNIPTAKEPPVVLNSSPSPQPSVEWTPLGKAQPTRGNWPMTLKFPGGAERTVRVWPRVSVSIFEWLYENGRFTLAMVPFESFRGATIVDSIKKRRKFEQVGNYPIYVNKEGPVSTHVNNWQFIAQLL